jgi:peptide/nickel transport system permease protein
VGTIEQDLSWRPAASAKRDSALGRFAATLREHPSLAVGLLIVGIVVAAALIGPLVMPYGPLATAPKEKLMPPSLAHPMGTDNFGRDILTRVVYAARLDLTIAFAVASIALLAGALLGTLTGYYGRLLDDTVMRVTDILFAFPSFILAMAITAMLGNKVINVIIAIVIAYVPYFIRLTRAEILSARELEYADAARCVGNPEWRIMYVHLLPNCLSPALVQAALCLGWAILDTSGLAFLGLGIRPPTPEWGVMVSEGAQNIISGHWWTWLFPGAMIVITAFGFHLIGDSLRDISAREEL